MNLLSKISDWISGWHDLSSEEVAKRKEVELVIERDEHRTGKIKIYYEPIKRNGAPAAEIDLLDGKIVEISFGRNYSHGGYSPLFFIGKDEDFMDWDDVLTYVCNEIYADWMGLNQKEEPKDE